MAALSKGRQPKWLQSMTLKPQEHAGADVNFMIAVTRADLEKARERGDVFGAANLSWQLDQLLRLRQDRDSDV